MSQTINLGGGSKMIWRGDEVLREVEEAVFAALAQFADIVATEARANAPKDSGDLAESIHTEVVERGSSFFGTKARSHQVRAESGHAAFVELGTSKTPAQPFLWPAYESKKRRALDLVKDII